MIHFLAITNDWFWLFRTSRWIKPLDRTECYDFRRTEYMNDTVGFLEAMRPDIAIVLGSISGDGLKDVITNVIEYERDVVHFVASQNKTFPESQNDWSMQGFLKRAAAHTTKSFDAVRDVWVNRVVPEQEFNRVVQGINMASWKKLSINIV